MLPPLPLISPGVNSSALPRPESAAILQSLRDGEMVLVGAPCASGLTTTLAAVADLGLGPRFVATCYVSGRDLPRDNPDDWFSALASRVAELLPAGWQAPPCSGSIEFRRFLVQLLSVLPQQVVLVLDDLQGVPDSTLQELAQLLRSIGRERPFQPFLQKLSCILGTHRLAHLDSGDAPLFAFCTRHRLQPVSREAMLQWLDKQPEVSRNPQARPAVAAWAGGNPVWAEQLLKRAPSYGLNTPAMVARAAAELARDEAIPPLSDEAHNLLQVLLSFGSQPATGDPVEEELLDLGWLRQRGERLVWAAPLAALYARRARQAVSEPQEQPWLLLDERRMEVRHRGRLVPLYPQELRLLFLLAKHPGRFYSIDAIYDHIADAPGEGLFVSPNIKVQVSRIRRKLPSADYIVTRRNVGYAFSTILPYEIRKQEEGSRK